MDTSQILHLPILVTQVTPVLEAVLASESAKVSMEHTIEHERTTSSAVKQLRNDLKDERSDHDEKVGR